MKHRSRDRPSLHRSSEDKFLDSYYGSLSRHTHLMGRAGRKLIKKGLKKEEQVKLLYHKTVILEMLKVGEPLSYSDKQTIFNTLNSLIKNPGGKK